jgi:RNA polymerase sigma factor for flagellar operon FliA
MVDYDLAYYDYWKEYKQTGDPDIRNFFIEEHYNLVNFIAGRIHKGLPNHVELDDLISHGTFGLMDAIEKFDPDKNIKFETYASTRIQGSILDELRAGDWVPRSVRSKQKAVDKKRAEMEAVMGATVSSKDIADELGWEDGEVSKTLHRSAAVLSIDQSHGDMDGTSVSYSETLATQDDGNSDLHQTLSNSVSEGLSDLDDKERVVVTLYYYENLTLQDIGTVLGVTESRVCQIHSKALLSMFDDLQ